MRRLKKVCLWTGIILGALAAILLVANAVLIRLSDAQLERQWAAIRKAGDPLTLADLAPKKPISPEQNAATYLRRVHDEAEAIDKEIWAVPEFRTYVQTYCYPMPLKIQHAIQATLAAHPKAVPLLMQAAACTDYAPSLDYSLSPNLFLEKMLPVVTESRAAARVLYYQSLLLTAEGRRDEAVQTGLAIFRLAHLLDHTPTFVGYLVAIAVRGHAVAAINEALQTGPISQNVRQALDAELAGHERMEGLAEALKRERAYVVSSFNTMPGRTWFIGRGWWNREELACLKPFATMIKFAGCSDSYRQVERMTNDQQSGMSRTVLPALKQGFMATMRIQAEIRGLRILNALQTHPASNGDRIPKLTELVLPPETLVDPFNGEPLHCRKEPHGWLIYSVGPNLKDNGGKLKEPNQQGDIGIGPPLFQKP